MNNIGHRWQNSSRRNWRHYIGDAVVYAAIIAVIMFGFWATSARVDDERIRPDASPRTTPAGHIPTIGASES